MAKCNRQGNNTLEHRKRLYVNLSTERELIQSLINGEYNLKNISKPIKNIPYQNGIGLLSNQRIQLLGIENLQKLQIPFLIGGKDQFKAMVGVITPYSDSQFNQAYLELLSVYENNPDFLKQILEEENKLKYQVLSQLGFDYEFSSPKVNLDTVNLSPPVKTTRNNRLEGRITSNISPFVEYIFKINEKDPILLELIPDEIKRVGEEYDYSFVA